MEEIYLNLMVGLHIIPIKLPQHNIYLSYGNFISLKRGKENDWTHRRNKNAAVPAL